MKNTVKLEDFGVARKPKPRAQPIEQEIPATPLGPSEEELEARRLAAYDQGYQAGWDDAVSAQSQDKDRIGAEFARNLQDLGFTFHEAKSHVMKTLEPLLSEMVTKVLPNLVSETLGQTIIEELIPFAEEASDAIVQIVVAPGSKSAIEAIIDTSLTIPMEILEETSLADGQVYLRMGELEKKIDMDSAIERIGQAIHSIYALNEEALKHG
jgi:flagellar assembly protein FliH